jgi:hypothetical protein
MAGQVAVQEGREVAAMEAALLQQAEVGGAAAAAAAAASGLTSLYGLSPAWTLPASWQAGAIALCNTAVTVVYISWIMACLQVYYCSGGAAYSSRALLSIPLLAGVCVCGPGCTPHL